MKKDSSAWKKMEKKMAWTLWWRWVITFGAALQIWSVVQHYKMHDVTGWSPLPSAWVLPWLTFACAGTCVVTAGIWSSYFYQPRPSE